MLQTSKIFFYKFAARNADTPLVYHNIQVIDGNSYVLEFTKKIIHISED